MTGFATQILGNSSNGLNHFIDEKPGILQKVYNLSKKTLGYLARNQHAMSIGLWSFVFTKSMVHAYEFLQESGEVFDLTNCNYMLCSHWTNETILHDSQDYHDLARRCVPAYPNYAPIRVYQECMDALCEYLSDLNLYLFECVRFKNESESLTASKFVQEQLVSSRLEQKNFRDESDFGIIPNRTLYYVPPLEELWRAVCPNHLFTTPKHIKQAKRLAHCLSKACDYYSVYEPDQLEEAVKFLCSSLDFNKIKNMLKDIVELQEELKEASSESSSGFSLLTGTIGVLSNVLTAVITGVIAFYTAKSTNVAVKVAASLPSVQSGLTGMLRTAAEAVQAVVDTGSNIREEFSMNSLSSFAQSIQNRIERINEGVIDFSETIVQQFELPEIGNKLFDANQIKVGKDIIKNTGESIQKITDIKVISDLGVVLLQNNLKQIDNLHLPRKIYDITYWSRLINNYLKDYISYDMSYVVRIQLARLKHSLMDWQGAFCRYEYPYHVFCKLPHSVSEDKPNFLPLNDLMRIFSEKNTGLCYSIWGDLWCHWVEFISYTAMKSHEEIACSSDNFFLNIKEYQMNSTYNIYEINSIHSLNDCYNLTALIKV